MNISPGQQFWYQVQSVITGRKRSCGKVMFLQVSVIVFTGGMHAPGGTCSWGCLLRGGRVPAPGGCLPPGGCLVLGVPGGDPFPWTATAAGGTHPTGMHSCLKVFWRLSHTCEVYARIISFIQICSIEYLSFFCQLKHLQQPKCRKNGMLALLRNNSLSTSSLLFTCLKRLRICVVEVKGVAS